MISASKIVEVIVAIPLRHSKDDINITVVNAKVANYNMKIASEVGEFINIITPECRPH